jgi:hypothetical protein
MLQRPKPGGGVVLDVAGTGWGDVPDIMSAEDIGNLPVNQPYSPDNCKEKGFFLFFQYTLHSPPII